MHRLPRRRPPSATPLLSRRFASLPGGRVSVREAKARKSQERFSLEDLGAFALPERRVRNLPRIGEVWSDAPLQTVHSEQGAVKPPPAARRRRKALEQGLLVPLEEATPLEPIQDRRYPPVVQQALDNMAELGPGVVLLTRVGGFYELYFSHAEQWASRMEIKLSWKKTTAGPVPMAGFPFWLLEKYLKILVEDERVFVAICEEYPRGEDADAATGGVDVVGLQFERRIARIVTPGTLIDEEWIEQGENHFLLAVERAEEGNVGLAWADIGTGEVFVTACEPEHLAAEVARIAPREVVCAKSEQGTLLELQERPTWVVSTYELETVKPISRWAEIVDSEEDVLGLQKLKTLELMAAERLLNYVGARMPGVQVKLQAPVRRDSSKVMGIDVNSMRGLEIKATVRDGTAKGSLLHTVNRTVTRGGRRLLGNWLTRVMRGLTEAANPSTDVDVIVKRLDLVETLLNDEVLRGDIIALLKRTHDSQRIVQKISMGRGDADDMVALAQTIVVTEELLERLTNTNKKIFRSIISRISCPSELADKILNAIDEEGLMRHQIEAADVAATISETPSAADVEESSKAVEELLEEVVEAGAGKKRMRKRRISQGIENSLSRATLGEADGDDAWIMKKTASPLLGELHARLQALREAKGHLEVHLRNKLSTLICYNERGARSLSDSGLDAQSLTLKWSPLLGHFCHVKGKDVGIPGVLSVSASKTTRSFLHPEWTRLGESINNVRLRIRTEEKEVFNSILKDVKAEIRALRGNAAVLDELDVVAGFAALAQEQNLIRPRINVGTKHKIVGGRHITVEAGLRAQGQQFVGNECYVGDKETLWLVTGPNMAGKSTFLRQNALISILAQTGSFVPATYANLGIVDRIFSRIGSADNLYNAQSTFMIEMLETAQILRSATQRSFVIMDEIGRGTAPRDGTAVAAAVLKHLVEKSKCRTLFATHFHELADMVGDDRRVATWCSDVKVEKNGSWSFVHKLREGVNRESHALRVARMAGMPGEVLKDAEEILKAQAKREKRERSIIEGLEVEEKRAEKERREQLRRERERMEREALQREEEKRRKRKRREAEAKAAQEATTQQPTTHQPPSQERIKDALDAAAEQESADHQAAELSQTIITTETSKAEKEKSRREVEAARKAFAQAAKVVAEAGMKLKADAKRRELQALGEKLKEFGKGGKRRKEVKEVEAIAQVGVREEVVVGVEEVVVGEEVVVETGTLAVQEEVLEVRGESEPETLPLAKGNAVEAAEVTVKQEDIVVQIETLAEAKQEEEEEVVVAETESLPPPPPPSSATGNEAIHPAEEPLLVQEEEEEEHEAVVGRKQQAANV
ncbi:muts domain V-domain-containing protein [Sphaerosporella brunnea]|uniref:Muts domain V-domain-containing protein n=1 Tax=Sphaerosporella brunnea TaxID=1250544 RepID=A0A5J5ECS1_9PEZI|nr:muts domain V-domain-containing protein [Sphaerosporella brunnea]